MQRQKGKWKDGATNNFYRFRLINGRLILSISQCSITLLNAMCIYIYIIHIYILYIYMSILTFLNNIEIIFFDFINSKSLKLKLLIKNYIQICILNILY